MAKVVNGLFSSIEQVTGSYPVGTGSQSTSTVNKGIGFNEVLESILREQGTDELELKFSKHASQRLTDRQLDISEDQMDRLNEGAMMAKEKGINNSLIMVDSLRFIVNTPNNTVVTAMDQNEEEKNVFTNIDGAVVM